VQGERLAAARPLAEDEERLLAEVLRTGRAAAQGQGEGERDEPGLMALPLHAGEMIVGAVLLRLSGALPDPWTRMLLEIVADEVGPSLRNAALHQVQVDIAARVQERLLPVRPPQVEGVEIAVDYRSNTDGATRGGDFLDFYHQTAGHLAVAVGDVAGRGVEAMATTFVAKHLLRALVTSGQISWPPQPGVALQELHNALLDELESERFVTALFLSMNIRTGALQLASAGHPAPFLVRRDRVERPLLLTAPAIGIIRSVELAPHPSETVTLAPGEAFLVFTDGLSEVRGEDGAFFEERLPGVLGDLRGRPAQDVVERVLAAAASFAAGPLADDLAVACVRRAP
jgi:serine phosphatase RsbU (regulator of sigma subunit)